MSWGKNGAWGVEIVARDNSPRDTTAKENEEWAVHGGQCVVYGVFFRIFGHEWKIKF